MASELFEDIFEVRQVNPDGKKFDKGTRCSIQGAMRCCILCGRLVMRLQKAARVMCAHFSPLTCP
jgi:hypothetical protein